MDHPAASHPHWSGSAVSAFVGWLTFCLTSLLVSHSKPDDPGNVIFFALILGVVTFLVWVFALLPLYILTPAESPLWRWWICTLSGTAAGTGIGCAFFLVLDLRGFFEHPFAMVGASLFLGGFVGGLTCLFGSLTVPLFRRRNLLLDGPSFDQRWVTIRARIRCKVRRGKAWFVKFAGQ